MTSVGEALKPNKKKKCVITAPNYY